MKDLLLLSLSATKGQRERSEVLDVGVTRDKNLREVIVKYSGDIDGLHRGKQGGTEQCALQNGRSLHSGRCGARQNLAFCRGEPYNK